MAEGASRRPVLCASIPAASRCIGQRYPAGKGLGCLEARNGACLTPNRWLLQEGGLGKAVFENSKAKQGTEELNSVGKWGSVTNKIIFKQALAFLVPPFPVPG